MTEVFMLNAGKIEFIRFTEEAHTTTVRGRYRDVKHQLMECPDCKTGTLRTTCGGEMIWCPVCEAAAPRDANGETTYRAWFFEGADGDRPDGWMRDAGFKVIEAAAS